MKQREETEPPSSPQVPWFQVGRDSHGNWVVQDPCGIRGGLFVDRDQALRFVRAENGNRPRDFVMVGGVLELDMSGAPATAQPGQAGTPGFIERPTIPTIFDHRASNTAIPQNNTRPNKAVVSSERLWSLGGGPFLRLKSVCECERLYATAHSQAT
jgi:hypothetical protein